MSKELEAFNDLMAVYYESNAIREKLGITKEAFSEKRTIVDTALKALDIIIKHTYSGGWSGDYTTEYWKMKNKEIEVIEKIFNGVPCHPLSEKHY